MTAELLLERVRVLAGPGQPLRAASVTIRDGRLAAIGEPTATATNDEGLPLLAPCLVDPHSRLDDPLQGRAETLDSLAAGAAAGGYGTVALLPWGHPWRDRPERLQLRWPDPLRLLQWGAFSEEGADQRLAGHGDQLAAGAIGLAGGAVLPPPALLERGLRLGEMAERPLLLAPRDTSLGAGGFVRERVEALRLGWPTEPVLSETLPLQLLLSLAEAHPQRQLRLMNLSTAEGVALLRRSPQPPLASVSWWHLVADSGSLDPTAEGWRVEPALGGPADRQALITALGEGLISAVAVQHTALDPEEQLLPLDQRRAGVAGHDLVLPLLWQELVAGHGWTPQQLWQALCWGPSRFLGQEAETLELGSRRWLLFDPQQPWRDGPGGGISRAANRPWPRQQRHGQVVACGLREPAAGAA